MKAMAHTDSPDGLPHGFGQPADPAIDPSNEFLLPFSFDEGLTGPAIESNMASNHGVDQPVFFPDWVNDDAYLDGPSHNPTIPRATHDDSHLEGFLDWSQSQASRHGQTPIGHPPSSLAPDSTPPAAEAHEDFDFSGLIDSDLLPQHLEPVMQGTEAPSPRLVDGETVTMPPALKVSGETRPGLPSPPVKTSQAPNNTTAAFAQPPLLEALKAKFEAQQQTINAANVGPSGHSSRPPASAVAGMLKAAPPTSETIQRAKPGRKTAARPVPASQWDRPYTQSSSMSQSPALSGMGTPQPDTPSSTHEPRRSRKKADKKGMPRTTISTNNLLVSGEDYAKKIAIQRIPLQVQEDDSEQVATNAHYWVPLIANAFDAIYQAQPDSPDLYTEAGLTEWTRWQEEHDDRIQAILYTHSKPQVLVQACAFLFLKQILEAHENGQGPVHVLRTVAVGGSDPYLKCSERIRAAISTLEKLTIVRYDLLRVERLADLAANPKGFGERKVENLWINYGKKRVKKPYLKREVVAKDETATPSPDQNLVSAQQPHSSDRHASGSGGSAPTPTSSSPPPMMHQDAQLGGQAIPPLPGAARPLSQQHPRKPRPVLQQTVMPNASAPRGMMQAAPRQNRATAVDITVSDTGRAEVVMSDRAMGKRKVEVLSEDDGGGRGVKRR